ncbi:MAG: hypothetical protein U5N85_05095 [Arcicella sp.]|nr:hypothetical protein [Arcicella sp.]
MEKYFENPDGWYDAVQKLKTTDALLDFFKRTFDTSPFPPDFAESAGVMDTMFNLLENLENEFRFEDFRELQQIIKEKQPEFYQKDGIYFVEGLLRFSLANDNIEEAKKLFEDVVNSDAPNESIETFLDILKLISWYNGTEKWMSDIIHKIYEPIKNDSNIFETVNVDLSEYLFAYQMQLAYQDFLEKGTLDIIPYLDYLKTFDFEFDEETKQSFQKWLVSPFDLQELMSYQLSNQRYFSSMLITYFSKYLFDAKQTSFIVASNVAAKMFEFWHDEKRQIKSFELTGKKFDKFLSKQISFMGGDYASIFGVAVGSIYMYDFLKNIDFIDNKTHENACSGIDEVLGMVSKMNKTTIYRNSFFKFWDKPDTDSNGAFQELVSSVKLIG